MALLPWYAPAANYRPEQWRRQIPEGERGETRTMDYVIMCAVVDKGKTVKAQMKFSELVRLLERNGFTLVREKGSIRYYGKPGLNRLIRVDYHGAREVPTGTCNAILKAAELRERG